MSESAFAIEAKALHKTYRVAQTRLHVVQGISVQVPANKIVALVGPSGAGKSTVLHMLGLLEKPDEGEVYLDGVPAFARSRAERARLRNRYIGFVFQFYHLLGDLDAVENVCLPTMVQKSIFTYRRRETRKRAIALLDRVGLGERLHHRPTQLSGGERQRVAIARALMNEPRLLLCDEPTGNLDSETAEGILDLIWELKRESDTTFVIVTHDEQLAERADHAIRIVRGKVEAR